MEWISVEDRLPVGRVKVLVAYQNGVTIAQRDGYLVSPRETHTYWRGVNGPKHQLTTVTHWMPLPPVPKSVKEKLKREIGYTVRERNPIRKEEQENEQIRD